MSTAGRPAGPQIRSIRIIPVMNVARGAVAAPSQGCSSCPSRMLCLPGGMSDAEVASLDSLGIGRRRVRAGQTLYRPGDRFQFIYAVRSGTFKSSMTLADGREHVSGFHMAGELMGLDGMASGAHASTAVALEDTEICAIPYSPSSDTTGASGVLHKAVTRSMSREIVREHSLMMLLGSTSAEERVAAFLLNISQRMKARGYSAQEFHLRMSRAEIGSYLGMKLETVSRTLSAFQQQGLLEVDKRYIRINDGVMERSFGLRIQ
jgi:CRP/FNR family transcriptional regulator